MIGHPGKIINWLGFYLFSQNGGEIVAWLCIMFSCVPNMLQKTYFYLSFSSTFCHKCRQGNFLEM